MKKFSALLILAFLTLAGKGQSFSWTGNTTIPDNQTITIPITVSGLPATINNSFGVAHICLDITHSYDADIVVKLQSPNGTIVSLIENVGGSGNNFSGTCIGMDGTAFTNAAPPYSGIFYPQGNVSSFNNGQNPNGTWNLLVSDVSIPDEGSIQNASIVFVNNPPVPGGSQGGPTGTYNCPTCVCPGGAANCDLLPDMTSSFKEINLNHQETPGFLYISNATPNIGYGPIDIYGIDSCFCGPVHVPCGTVCPNGEEIKHSVKQRIYQKVAGSGTLSFYDRLAGKMTYHPAHGHLHIDDWASYTLRSATSNPDATTWPIIATGVKQSFCLINLGTCPGNPGECTDNNGNPMTSFPNYNLGFHTGCGMFQGIYVGNYDVYSISLNDPIPLANVCNGTYYIVSITDPNNDFLESDETNNWVAVPITLTQQNVVPAITATGPTTFCTGGSVTLTASPAANYLWSNGQTTQSIVVTTAGTFTVSTNCGSTTSTSPPVTTSIVPPGSTVSVTVAQTTGTNPACAGVPVTFTATHVNGGNAPSYQWKVNGSNVGTNSPTYTTSTLTNGQVVSCVLTSNIPCLVSTPAASNNITMQVNPAVDPTVTIALTTGTNPSCQGANATFTATVANGTNPAYQWKLNGTNVGGNSNQFSSTGITNGQAVRCDITSTAICPIIRTLGTGTGVNDYRSDLGAAYPTYYGNGRQQYLVRASELIALGLSAGNISSIGFSVAGQLGDPATLNGYTIKIGQTGNTSMTSTFQAPAFQTVFGPLNYTPTLNSINTHTFTTPFVWNGTSNLVIDICFSNQVVGNAAYQTHQTPTPGFTSTTYYQADGSSGAGACTRVTGVTGTVRPNMIFTSGGVKNASSNTITMAIDPATYTFTGSGNWNVASNWLNNIMPPAVLLSCAEIFIDPVAGTECILNIVQTIPQGAKVTVMPGKKFRILGDLIIQ